MTDMTITGGVDTHTDTHTAAALDSVGKTLGSATFPATACGYVSLLDWLHGFGAPSRVGIEGTGSYGAGLARYLTAQGVRVVEVNRPNRQTRRRNGKSDPADAEAAARATLAEQAIGLPKSQDGIVEAIRILRVERKSAIQARTQAANQLHAVVSTAPEPLRTDLRELSLPGLIARARKGRAMVPKDSTVATKRVLRGLAERWAALDKEVAGLDKELEALVKQAAPILLELHGVGVEVAGALLVAAGDNPARLSDEAAFAAMCGVSPVDASSGRQQRHRLNRGGNRDANRALWVVALVRLRSEPRTRAYVERRTSQGLSKREILRCLKRYIVREIFKILRASNHTDEAQKAA